MPSALSIFFSRSISSIVSASCSMRSIGSSAGTSSLDEHPIADCLGAFASTASSSGCSMLLNLSFLLFILF
ncbi:hypothetical protein BKA63DRAFT_527560 [Paraphoma chrysanthemicola]|nr:hypothetical protein BKA63DRAFT_527560 [Paraphoma chrysanthemicola]